MKKYITFLLIMTNYNHENLIDIKKVNKNILVDLKYATNDNFTKKIIYNHNICYIHKDIAPKVNAIQKELEAMGLSLLIWDGYRTKDAQEKFWQLVPDERFVAHPKKGSRHNRGVAIDCTLATKDGNLLKMPTNFDDFSEKAHAYYSNLPAEVIKNRQTLQDVMCKYGFKIMPYEWWHFDLVGWEKYPLMDFETH